MLDHAPKLLASVSERPLAVIIPAFRGRHFAEALESLAAQTNPNFNVYIGDDCSSDGLEAIVDGFRDRLNITYVRFPNNLGGSDLVEHWHRCVSMSRFEPWIWMFSDDDVAEPECAENFLKHVRSGLSRHVHLLRFQIDIIDGQGRRTSRPVGHPKYETTPELLRALMSDRRRAWRAQDHIFSRHVYNARSGFVKFPKALYSDYATWLSYSQEGGVCTIDGARVLWRNHSQGTSSGMRRMIRNEWQQATREYLCWLEKFSMGNEALMKEYGGNARGLFFRQCTIFVPALSAGEQAEAVRFAVRIFGIPRLYARMLLRTALWRRSLVRHQWIWKLLPKRV